MTWSPLDPTEIGVAVQRGALRADHGPDQFDVQCSNCAATWVGPVGEECAYCAKNVEPGDDTRPDFLVDWPAFWASEIDDGEWLADPVLPAGRSTVIYAKAGVGKSLLALWIAYKLSTGVHPFDHTPVAPIDVLYLDYEMTEDDLRERLEQMGAGPETDLTRLHYAIGAPTGPLDSDNGGDFVRRLANQLDVALVVIDTMGQAVGGEENEADTYRRYAQRTGRNLKADGRAVLRCDHAGKDLAKGQRGSSAKNDDADVIWLMAPRDDGFRLTASKRRVGWVPAEVDLMFEGDDRVEFRLALADTVPAGTAACIEDLDRLGADDALSVRKSIRLLKDNDLGRARDVIQAACKERRKRTWVRPDATFDPDATKPHVNGQKPVYLEKPMSVYRHGGLSEEIHADPEPDEIVSPF